MDRVLCFMLIFFGGGLGCLVRLFLDGSHPSPWSPANIASCMLMGASYACICYRFYVNNKYILSFFNVGFLGGLSTFTPLALYGFLQQEENLFVAMGYLLGMLLFFVVVAIIGYIIAVLVLQYGLKRQRSMSRLASGRYLYLFKSLLPQWQQIQTLNRELADTGADLKDDEALGPVNVGKRDQLKSLLVNHYLQLTTLEVLFNQAIRKENCINVDLDAFTVSARDSGEFIEPNQASYKEQLDFLERLAPRLNIKSLSAAVAASTPELQEVYQKQHRDSAASSKASTKGKKGKGKR